MTDHATDHLTEHVADPHLDLVLERTVPVAPERVWAAWTDPALLMQWFTPAPWKTVECEIDLRPGGRFRVTMESPEGERFPNNAGCYLQVEPNRLLVFTSVLGDGFRPAEPSNGAADLPFTTRVEITPTGDGGSHYRAVVLHADEAGAARHRDMGFHEGWGAALDQLVTLMS